MLYSACEMRKENQKAGTEVLELRHTICGIAIGEKKSHEDVKEPQASARSSKGSIPDDCFQWALGI
jgi:hypothetical protein